MANQKYVSKGLKKYELVVEVVENVETKKEYINYSVKVNGHTIHLSLRNYTTLANDIVKEDVLKK